MSAASRGGVLHIGLCGRGYRPAWSTACAAERGDDDLADQVVGAKTEQSGEKAADHGADDADQQVHQQVLLAPHDVGGQRAGDQADHEEDY
jgi:hypothetical protein